MKFQSVADARRHLWKRLLTELDHLEHLGVLDEEECEDDFDMRRMKKALEQVKKAIGKKCE